MWETLSNYFEHYESKAVQNLTFLSYLSLCGKSYSTMNEYNKRLELFLATNEKIKTHNTSPEENYLLGHNYFSDWTQDEFNFKLLEGFKLNPKLDRSKHTKFTQKSN